MFFNSLWSQRIGTRDLIIGFDWNYKMYVQNVFYIPEQNTIRL